MIKRFLIAILLVGLVVGGLVGFNLFRAKMIGQFFASRPVPTVTVSAAEVRPMNWAPEIEAIGSLVAAQGVDVASQTAGVVTKVAFNANDQVEEGQLLVQIDDAIERAELIAAQAAIKRDEAQLERATRLEQRGVSSEATLQEAQTTLAASRSTLERLKAVIEQKAIKAPFSGTIGIPRVDVGAFVQAGTSIATLQQLDTMKADFTVPEQRLGDLRLGQEAMFALQGDDFRYRGRITGIDPKIDPATRLVSVRAEVENSDGVLRPGQFVQVRIRLPAEANIIAIPQTSVVTSLYGDYVFVVEEEKPSAAEGEAGSAGGAAPPAAPAASTGAEEPAAGGEEGPKLVAKQVFVVLGRRQGQLVEIAKGLEPGQQVITSGQNKLSNNAPVAIDNSIDPAKVALEEQASSR
ncbi:efflux RND transporter periplasmic adaptor subunit [Propylenella binzhouense]|uniref:Efflux RND transporter periplasmic adaptor subunit n=1 Tax=Propylenella binzhouense TaxID=2555902 RepID=A0A964T4J3_9HYPH|nr:efflux RND transporter periplasmic adaptor subunit [Propylenella binzhouense]MYZ48204.1 efflux RND transporter periplasmic adaptor subunit [Propylenella binzhouense]